MKPKPFLPMTWCYEQGHTFRWGRGAGVITVHRGDVRGSHGDEALVDTVRVGRDWVDDRDLRLEARRWLRAREGRAREGGAREGGAREGRAREDRGGEDRGGTDR